MLHLRPGRAEDNGLSQKSNEALKDRSGEDIVAQDLEEQMKRERK